MNAINKALNEIKFNIPPEILNIAFMEYAGINTNKIITLDEMIITKVIKPRCMVDCNLMQGIEMKIDLNQCNVYRTETYEYLIDVPKAVTQGKSILVPLELICNVMYGNYYGSCSANNILSTGSLAYNNLANASVIQSSKLELIGENNILVHDQSIIILNGILRARIEYDSNMSNLLPSSYINFGKLCILAVKAYIYNYLKVKLDKGYLYGGHELGVINEIIDSYSDANEQYYEFLTDVMRKTLYMTQSMNLNNFVKSMFGNIT